VAPVFACEPALCEFQLNQEVGELRVQKSSTFSVNTTTETSNIKQQEVRGAACPPACVAWVPCGIFTCAVHQCMRWFPKKKAVVFMGPAACWLSKQGLAGSAAVPRADPQQGACG
jgi:hypothetical protein